MPPKQLTKSSSSKSKKGKRRRSRGQEHSDNPSDSPGGATRSTLDHQSETDNAWGAEQEHEGEASLHQREQGAEREAPATPRTTSEEDEEGEREEADVQEGTAAVPEGEEVLHGRHIGPPLWVQFEFPGPHRSSEPSRLTLPLEPPPEASPWVGWWPPLSQVHQTAFAILKQNSKQLNPSQKTRHWRQQKQLALVTRETYPTTGPPRSLSEDEWERLKEKHERTVEARRESEAREAERELSRGSYGAVWRIVELAWDFSASRSLGPGIAQEAAATVSSEDPFDSAYAALAIAGLARRRPDMVPNLLAAGLVERFIRAAKASTPSILGELKPAPLSDADERIRIATGRALLALCERAPLEVVVRFDLPGLRIIRSSEGWQALLSLAHAGNLEPKSDGTFPHPDSGALAESAAWTLYSLFGMTEACKSFLRRHKLREIARLSWSGTGRVRVYAAAALGRLVREAEGQYRALTEGLHMGGTAEMAEHFLNVLNHSEEKHPLGADIGTAAWAATRASLDLSDSSQEAMKWLTEAYSSVHSWNGAERELAAALCAVAGEQNGAEALTARGLHERVADLVAKVESTPPATVSVCAQLLALLGKHAKSSESISPRLDASKCYLRLVLAAEELQAMEEDDERRSSALSLAIAAELLAPSACQSGEELGRRAPEVGLLELASSHSSQARAHAASLLWQLMCDGAQRGRLVAGGAVDGLARPLYHATSQLSATAGEGRAGRRDLDRVSLSRAVEFLFGAIWLSLYPPTKLPAAAAAPEGTRGWERVRRVVMGTQPALRRRQAGGAGLSQGLLDVLAAEAVGGGAGDKATRLALSCLHTFAAASGSHARVVGGLGFMQSLKGVVTGEEASPNSQALAGEVAVMLTARQKLEGLPSPQVAGSSLSVAQQCGIAHGMVFANEGVLVDAGAKCCAALSAYHPREVAESGGLERLVELSSFQRSDAAAALVNLSADYHLQPKVAQKGLDVLLRLNNEGKGQKIKLLVAAALNNLSAHPANATAMYRAELGAKAERALSSAQKHKRGLQAELQSSLLKPQRSLWRRVAFDSYGLFKPERGSQLALWQPRVERYEASANSELDLLGDSHYNSPLAYSHGSKHRERLSVPHMVGRNSEHPRPDPIRHAASSRPFRPEPFSQSDLGERPSSPRRQRSQSPRGQAGRPFSAGAVDSTASKRWRPDSVKVVLGGAGQSVSFNSERVSERNAPYYHHDDGGEVGSTEAHARMDITAKEKSKHRLCMFAAVPGSNVASKLFPTYVLPSGRTVHYFHQPSRIIGPVHPGWRPYSPPVTLASICQDSFPSSDSFLLATAGDLDDHEEAASSDQTPSNQTGASITTLETSVHLSEGKPVSVKAVPYPVGEGERVPCSVRVGVGVHGDSQEDEEGRANARLMADGQAASFALFGQLDAECERHCACFDAAWEGIAPALDPGKGSAGSALASSFSLFADAFRSICARRATSECHRLALEQGGQARLLGPSAPRACQELTADGGYLPLPQLPRAVLATALEAFAEKGANEAVESLVSSVRQDWGAWRCADSFRVLELADQGLLESIERNVTLLAALFQLRATAEPGSDFKIGLREIIHLLEEVEAFDISPSLTYEEVHFAFCLAKRLNPEEFSNPSSFCPGLYFTEFVEALARVSQHMNPAQHSSSPADAFGMLIESIVSVNCDAQGCTRDAELLASLWQAALAAECSPEALVRVGSDVERAKEALARRRAGRVAPPVHRAVALEREGGVLVKEFVPGKGKGQAGAVLGRVRGQVRERREEGVPGWSRQVGVIEGEGLEQDLAEFDEGWRRKTGGELVLRHHDCRHYAHTLASWLLSRRRLLSWRLPGWM